MALEKHVLRKNGYDGAGILHFFHKSCGGEDQLSEIERDANSKGLLAAS